MHGLLNQRQSFSGECSVPFTQASLNFDKCFFDKNVDELVLCLQKIRQSSYRHYKHNKLRFLLKSTGSSSLNISWIDWYPNWNTHQNFITDILDLFDISYRTVENPYDADLIFAGVYGTNLVETRLYEKKFIVLVSGENVRPNYLFYDYSITTDSYSYAGKNIRWPEYFSQLKYDNKRNISAKEDLSELSDYYREWNDRDIMFSIIYNNACPHREHFTNLLQDKYGRAAVQSYGSTRIGRDCNKYEILGRSKFHLAFENSLHPGYVTEKLFQSLLMGTFALYWGANDVSYDFGDVGYINLASSKYYDNRELFKFIDTFDSSQSLRDQLNRCEPSISHVTPSTISSVFEDAETLLSKLFSSLLYYKNYHL